MSVVRQFGKKQFFVNGLLIVIALLLCLGISYVYSNRYKLGFKHSTTISAVSVTSPNMGPAQSNSSFSQYPAWSQNFSDYGSESLNSKFWNINEGPAQNSNHEAEYYTNSPQNLNISGGTLNLQATHQTEPEGYQYGSARVDTSSKVSFLYGRLDITAKIPGGVGMWPAVWLLPSNSKYEDLSPPSYTNRYLNGGEIDLIESVGFQPNVEYGIVHTISDLNNPYGVGSYSTVTLPNNDQEYYTYTLLWTPTTITFAVNNIPFYSYARTTGANYTTWPFDQPFYLILNLAVGGSWGGEDTSHFPNGIDNSAFPATMSIKSIYYYPYIGN